MADPEVANLVNNVMKEEIFGPLLHVVNRVAGLEEAIALTKERDTHGLAGAIFTGNQDDVMHYAAGVNITSLSVNEAPKDRSPRGPHGHPGFATIGGRNHFALYCSSKVVVCPTPVIANGMRPY